MNLIGRKIRIEVNEPWDWADGDLFGSIVSEHGEDSILVELTKEVAGKKITSTLMVLKVRYEKETFKPLALHQAVTANGALVSTDKSNSDFIIIGTATLE